MTPPFPTTQLGHGLLWGKAGLLHPPIHPLSKVSVQEHTVVMFTMKITHLTFHRNCFHGITLAWQCWDHGDNPPKVGLETINLNHPPKKRVCGWSHSPVREITVPKKPTTKPSRALLFIYLIFFGNILIVIECSTSYSKYRTVTNSWLKSVREITT